MMKIKVEKVHPWRQLFKRWSVWLNAIGAFFLAVDPQTISQIWLMMPADIKASFPEWVPKAVGASMMILGFISLNVKQRNIDRD